jgi:hypothetical protein
MWFCPISNKNTNSCAFDSEGNMFGTSRPCRGLGNMFPYHLLKKNLGAHPNWRLYAWHIILCSCHPPNSIEKIDKIKPPAQLNQGVILPPVPGVSRVITPLPPNLP